MEIILFSRDRNKKSGRFKRDWKEPQGSSNQGNWGTKIQVLPVRNDVSICKRFFSELRVLYSESY